jgi:hypothetical protein
MYKGAVAPVVLLVNKKYAMTKECEENMWDNYFMPTSTASCDLAKSNSANNFRLNCDLADLFARPLNQRNKLFVDSKVHCVTNNGTTKDVFEKHAGVDAAKAELFAEVETNFTVSTENREWHNGDLDLGFEDKSIQTYYYGYVSIPVYYFNQSWHNRRR